MKSVLRYYLNTTINNIINSASFFLPFFLNLRVGHSLRNSRVRNGQKEMKNCCSSHGHGCVFRKKHYFQSLSLHYGVVYYQGINTMVTRLVLKISTCWWTTWLEHTLVPQFQLLQLFIINYHWWKRLFSTTPVTYFLLVLLNWNFSFIVLSKKQKP